MSAAHVYTDWEDDDGEGWEIRASFYGGVLGTWNDPHEPPRVEDVEARRVDTPDGSKWDALEDVCEDAHERECIIERLIGAGGNC